MLNFFKTSFKYGFGLAAISAVFFITINKQWINSDFFSFLSAEQTFWTYIISLVIALILSLGFLICHHIEKNSKQQQTATASDDSIAVISNGNGNVTVNKRN